VALRLDYLDRVQRVHGAIYPTWIAPLFTGSPDAGSELKERVERLMARCGFRVKGLMVMDGSRAGKPRQRLLHGVRNLEAHRVLRHRCSRA